MTLAANAFKTALREGRPQIGLWSSLCSNVVAEIIAHAGYDWILIDTEHAPNELPDVLAQLHAMIGGTAEPIVRPAWNDAVLIKRFMDIGARTLLLPFVQSAEEARRAGAAARYPPHGVRGVATGSRAVRYGRAVGYHRAAGAEACVLVQVETRAALAEIEAIAAVDGVDVLFIGPSDLAADFGHLGESGHPEVQAAIADACARIGAAGKAPGILAPIEADARRYLEMGFLFVAVGSDLGLLARESEALARCFRPALQVEPGV